MSIETLTGLNRVAVLLICIGQEATSKIFEELSDDEIRQVTRTMSTIDHIPDSAPCYERWRTDYLRGPYLRSLSQENLRNRFDEVTLLATLPMLVETPLPLAPEGVQLAMQCFFAARMWL